jgi:hypothetical protein
MNKGKKERIPAQRMRTIVKAQVNDNGIFWINGHRVNMLTGWSKRDLEYLREEGNVTFKKEGNEVRYDLDSVWKYYEKVKRFKTA